MVVAAASATGGSYPRGVKRLLALLGVILLVFIGGGVARAHSELVSTIPEDGQVLDAPPTEVTFTFNEDLMPDFVNFVATDSAGVVTELRVTGVSGPTATIAWPADAPGGDWRVDYRVVSQDGHPVEGAISFAYAAASPSPSPSSSSAAPSPSTSSAAPAPSPTSVQPSPSVSPAADTESSGLSTGWIIAIVGVIALIIIVIVGLLTRRRSS